MARQVDTDVLIKQIKGQRTHLFQYCKFFSGVAANLEIVKIIKKNHATRFFTLHNQLVSYVIDILNFTLEARIKLTYGLEDVTIKTWIDEISGNSSILNHFDVFLIFTKYLKAEYASDLTKETKYLEKIAILHTEVSQILQRLMKIFQECQKEKT